MSSDPPGDKKPSTKLQTFLRRLLSTVVLWAVVLGALFSGKRWIADSAVLVVLNFIGIYGILEFTQLARAAGQHVFRGFALVCGLLMLSLTWWVCSQTGGSGLYLATQSVSLETALLGLFAFALLLRRLFWKDMNNGISAIACTALAFIYVPWMLNFIQKFYFLNGDAGSLCLLYFILVTKCSDMGAYATGSLIGKHKMIPRISPGKTWEGFAGAIVLSTLVSLVFAHFAQDHIEGLTLVHALVLGVLLSVGAVAGDLVESLFKREAGAKDSGQYFPGIGGILDLVDSLLFNAPLIFAYWVLFISGS